MDPQLEQLLKAAEAYVEGPPEGRLAWAWRIRLWYHLRQTDPDALLRRQILSHVIARRAMPMWDAIRERVEPEFRNLPDRDLCHCRAVILGTADYEDVLEYDGENEIGYFLTRVHEFGLAAACPALAVAALTCAGSDEEAAYEDEDGAYDLIGDPSFMTEYDEEAPEWGAWEAH
ncbi:MAG: hypothetical protein ACK47B_22905 [Armatimonadota bacterium]